MSSRREIVRHLPAALRRAGAKVSGLRFPELLLLVQAPVMLPLAALALKRWGLRRVQGVLSRLPLGAGKADLDVQGRRATAQRLAWCVQVSAAYGPWPANCLQRSLVLWWFLRRRGLEGDLRIGVRRDQDSGKLDFHAWVEHGGCVINDRRDVRERYATFDRPIVPAVASFR